MSGALILFVATMFHPMHADPNDALAAFTEYAADRYWIASHLGQFLGVALIAVALVALAATTPPGRALASARIGAGGAVAGLATAAGLQAVDGIALHKMVHRWAAATGEARERVFEAAFAVRQVEIGFASLLSVLFGLTICMFGISMITGRRFPAWLGWLGLCGGLANVAAGLVQAYTGFSGLAMNVSIPASGAVLLWVITMGVLLWRAAPAIAEREEAV